MGDHAPGCRRCLRPTTPRPWPVYVLVPCRDRGAAGPCETLPRMCTSEQGRQSAAVGGADGSPLLNLAPAGTVGHHQMQEQTAPSRGNRFGAAEGIQAALEGEMVVGAEVCENSARIDSDRAFSSGLRGWKGAVEWPSLYIEIQRSRGASCTNPRAKWLFTAISVAATWGGGVGDFFAEPRTQHDSESELIPMVPVEGTTRTHVVTMWQIVAHQHNHQLGVHPTTQTPRGTRFSALTFIKRLAKHPTRRPPIHQKEVRLSHRGVNSLLAST